MLQGSVEIFLEMKPHVLDAFRRFKPPLPLCSKNDAVGDGPTLAK